MLVLSSMNFRHALLARTSVQRLAGNPGDPLQASDERDPSSTPLIAATYPPRPPSKNGCMHGYLMGYILASHCAWLALVCQRVRIVIPLSLTRGLLLVKRAWVSGSEWTSVPGPLRRQKAILGSRTGGARRRPSPEVPARKPVLSMELSL